MRTLSTKIIDKRLSMVHGMEGLVPYVLYSAGGWAGQCTWHRRTGRHHSRLRT